MNTQSSTNRIAKNTMFMYLRMALVMAVSLYTVRVVLRVLGVEDYGIYSAVGGIISSLSFITGVLAVASQRFFSVAIGKNDNGELSKVFNMILSLYLIVGAVIILIAETAGLWFMNNKMIIPQSRMNAAFWVFQSTVIIFIISIIASPFQAIIVAYERMNIYAYIGILEVVLKLVIVFVLQVFAADKLILYAFLLLVTSMLVQSIYLLYCRKEICGVELEIKWDKATFKDIVSFSGWSLFGSVSYICNTQGLNLLLNTFFGPIVNAAYLIGNQVKSAINQFSSNFYIAARPSMIMEFTAGNMEYVKKLYNFSTKTIFILLFIFVFPISMQAYDVLQLWLGEVGDYMVDFVRLMLIYAIVLSLNDPITSIVQAANEVKKYHLLVDGFTLLTLPLSYVAFKIGMSPVWAFFISIIIFVIAHFIRLVILRNITGFSIRDYLSQIVLRFIVTFVVSFILAKMFNCFFDAIGIMATATKIFFEFIVAVLACWFIILEKPERDRIQDMIISKIKK